MSRTDEISRIRIGRALYGATPGAVNPRVLESSRSCRQQHPETMKMIPLLIKEGSGVVDRHGDAGTHHSLPPPPLRRGVTFRAGD
jgi:hypothetical protein